MTCEIRVNGEKVWAVCKTGWFFEGLFETLFEPLFEPQGSFQRHLSSAQAGQWNRIFLNRKDLASGFRFPKRAGL